MEITYIGHATLLLQIGGVRVLTDPNFEPTLGRLLARVSAPGVALDALPALDALLLTHAHADHLSFKSLDRLPRDIPLYAPPAVARWLNRKGYRHATPLDDGESVAITAVIVALFLQRQIRTGSAPQVMASLRNFATLNTFVGVLALKVGAV